MIQPLSAIKKACFSGQVAMVIPDSWSSGNVAGKYAGQPLKAGEKGAADGEYMI